MARVGRNDGSMIVDINVTPLVDVVLVLLVILMVTASYVVSKSISVDLPNGATGETVPTTLAITVDATGRLFLDGAPVDEAVLRTRTRTARARDDQARAVIAADGSAEHRHVVRVIDLMRQEKIFRFAVNVRPSELSDG
jgi:biopolymer transport protein ExbD